MAHERFLWIADPGRNFLFVADTAEDEIVNRIGLVSDMSQDPTPPVGVLDVHQGGRDGRFFGVAPVTNADCAGVERADVHALAVRQR